MPKVAKQDEGFQDLMSEVLAARRTVVTVGVETQIARWELDFHSHKKAQLMLSLRGVGMCEAAGSIWIVPPGAAIFIPQGIRHRVAAAGNIKGYAVFIEGKKSPALPVTCTTIRVNNLLRELIIRSANFPANFKQGGMESRINALLLEEIAAAPTGGLHLRMPTDARIRAVFQSMMENPANRGTVDSWAKRAGMSERTLARVISTETGMSFGRWRQQLNLLLALQWMAQGATVQQVSSDLGYQSVGSFVTMFRKALGEPPARYMAQHASDN